MNQARVLVAGIGNIFLGDDAFGVEVVRRLSHRTLPDAVQIKDFGIRGMDLSYALLNPYELVILVDTVSRGEKPGSLFVIEPSRDVSQDCVSNAHAMAPEKVISMALSLGAELKNIRLVGCEPETFGDELEGKMGLSDAVGSSIDGAVALIEQLVSEHLNGTKCHA